MTRSAHLGLLLMTILWLGACGPTTRPPIADPDRATLGCLDRATQIAIRIENGSRDADRLQPCAD
ncbi:hypothetical protein JQC91_08795 [Jannaschia sp. Os4]|uniref:hypothetical protein n=1 Tax=Jannaschia sp. Os4 TaxID=2807617 RepID=UPI00193A316D|nr:hypothetical protein [Jannaschia sp. Os4]MBM2576404.1 hypothetical protein [Jannaschia sp. Os4]